MNSFLGQIKKLDLHPVRNGDPAAVSKKRSEITGL